MYFLGTEGQEDDQLRGVQEAGLPPHQVHQAAGGAERGGVHRLVPV